MKGSLKQVLRKHLALLVVILLVGSYLGYSVGSFTPSVPTSAIETREDLHVSYWNNVFEVYSQMLTGQLSYGEATLEIEEILAMAQRHEIDPEDWCSPPDVVIEAGWGVEGDDFIVFTDGSGNYYARSGFYGDITTHGYSGTNFATVMNNAIGSISEGSIRLQKGNYYALFIMAAFFAVSITVTLTNNPVYQVITTFNSTVDAGDQNATMRGLFNNVLEMQQRLPLIMVVVVLASIFLYIFKEELWDRPVAEGRY